MEVDSKILESFAKDLESLLENFGEKMEILSNKVMMPQIEKTRRAKMKNNCYALNPRKISSAKFERSDWIQGTNSQRCAEIPQEDGMAVSSIDLNQLFGTCLKILQVQTAKIRA